MKKKLILLFLSSFLVSWGFSQIIAVSGSNYERIEKACQLLRTYDYDVYESMVVHSIIQSYTCLLYTSPSPRDRQKSRMPSSA